MAKITGQDFTVYRGTFRQIVIKIRDAAGDPQDLTGFGTTWELSRSRSATVTELVLKTSLALVNVDGTFDAVVIPLEAADTVNLVPGFYFHELRLVDLASKPHVAATGKVEVEPAGTSAPPV